MSRNDLASQSASHGAEPDESDYHALAEFRSLLRRFLAFSDAAAAAAGLTAQRYQALLAIKVHAGGDISVGALAEELLIKPHSAAELVNRLEAAGLVRRCSDTSDRRRVLLTLTEAGSSRLSQLARAQLDELEAQRAALMSFVDALQKTGRSSR